MRGIRFGRLATIAMIASGCGGVDNAAESGPLRVDTLPDGSVRIEYRERPDLPTWRLVESMRIGSVDGTDGTAFGDVRSIERREDGSILVLDYLSSEVRSFSPDGSFQEVVVRGGDGPGEIGRANGMVLDAEGTLWINDHGNWRIVGVPTAGSPEIYPMPVTAFGYLWEGGLTDDDRWWERHTQVGLPDDFDPMNVEPGLVDQTGHLQLISRHLDRETPASDTIPVRDYPMQFIRASSGGATVVPFRPEQLTAVDPSGFLWTGWGGEYRLQKISLETGGVLLEIAAPGEAAPVSSEDFQEAVENLENFEGRAGSVGVDPAEVFPSTLPIFDQIRVDDRGRLWVRRVLAGDDWSFDVFSSNGEWLAEVTAEIDLLKWYLPTIRGDEFLTVVQDELEVAYVVRARIEGATP